MTYAPPKTTYDVGFMLPDGSTIWAAKSVDKMEAEDYAFHPKKPKGSKFVCKQRR